MEPDGVQGGPAGSAAAAAAVVALTMGQEATTEHTEITEPIGVFSANSVPSVVNAPPFLGDRCP
jgi:cobalamin biosynthesis protein CbiD